MEKFYKHKCLQCGKEFTNKYPDSKFHNVACSVDYHLAHVNFYKKDDSLCELCHGQKQIATEKYCNSCQDIVDNFNKLEPRCYICHNVINKWDLTYYQTHGRICIKCLIKENEKRKNK